MSHKRSAFARSLAPRSAVVWWMATDAVAAADQERWIRLLGRSERIRAGRFRFAEDRRDFIAAHALLRSLLTFYLLRPPAAWRFTTGRAGKPRLAKTLGPPHVDFNLSHTRGLVAAAIAAHGIVGVDVEKIDPEKADSAVADANFAAEELAILRATPESQRSICFFRLWTLKEAYLKAIGAGLATPLHSFAFTLAPLRINFVAKPSVSAAAWTFKTLPATSAHVLSVAAAGHAGKQMRVVTRAIAAGDIK